MSLPRYAEYKDSGVAWLGQVPTHWNVVALKRIVSIPITDGPHETPTFLDEGVPFVSAEAVSSGKVDFSKIRGFISPEENLRFSEKYVPALHDIYMVKSGATTGIVAIVESEREFNIWSPLAAIRCDQRVALPYFLLNYLRSRNFQEGVTLNWSFGTQQNIGMGVLGSLSVAMPPSVEQSAIAAFLDREAGKINALIAEQEKLLTLLAEKRQATISHAVTRGLDPNATMKDSGVPWLGEVPAHWTTPPLYLRYACELGKMLDSAKISGEHLLPYLRNTDVQWDRINVTDLPEMDIPKGEYPRYTVQAGDLLVCEGGEVGRSAVVGEVPFVLGFQKALHRLRPCMSRENPRFMYYTLRWAAGHGVFDGAGQATIAHLTGEQLRAYRFAKPPIFEQDAIVEFLDSEIGKLDELRTEAELGIELLRERRGALIAAAVTGKIDVRQAA